MCLHHLLRLQVDASKLRAVLHAATQARVPSAALAPLSAILQRVEIANAVAAAVDTMLRAAKKPLPHLDITALEAAIQGACRVGLDDPAAADAMSRLFHDKLAKSSKWAHLAGKVNRDCLPRATASLRAAKAAAAERASVMHQGQSIALTGLQHICIKQVWGWGGMYAIHLDASCICYGFQRQHLTDIDYRNKFSTSGLTTDADGDVAIRHLGDSMDLPNRQGAHTIDINLQALSDEVASLYLTLSGYRSTLRAVIRPELKCFELGSSTSTLARYELSVRPNTEYTAAVMARIWRERPGAPWQVSAIGELCMGSTGVYLPIHAKIDQL